MEVTLALMASESMNRILGVLGFLLLLPVLVFVFALVGRRIVEKRHAQELASEVEAGDDDWLRRTIGGDHPAK
jgi:hypothetical protein